MQITTEPRVIAGPWTRGLCGRRGSLAGARASRSAQLSSARRRQSKLLGLLEECSALRQPGCKRLHYTITRAI